MNYKVNKDHSFIKKGGGAGNKVLPDYSKGYGVPKKGKTTLPDNTDMVDVTDDPKYSKSKKAGKRVYKNSKTNQITTHEKVDKKNQTKDDPAMNIDRASGKGN